MVPGCYKSQMVNLASKGKVRIELMVTGGGCATVTSKTRAN